MSFSVEVKKEIAGHGKTARHCALAELSAILHGMGGIEEDAISFRSENSVVMQRIGELLERVFRIAPEIQGKQVGKNKILYELHIQKQEKMILKTCKYHESLEEILKNNCCKRAFLRGAFLASGSISNPEKTYHLEFAVKTEEMAKILIALLQEFEIDAKKIRRKNNPVVYLKEGEQIVRILNVLSAHMALMELENLRIMKEMRNSINRKVNCETANLNKIAQAGLEQNLAIDYIESTIGLDELPRELKEVALLRRENRESSLKELGLLLTPPLGRSGVNHRLKRIIQIAEEVKERREEKDNDK